MSELEDQYRAMLKGLFGIDFGGVGEGDGAVGGVGVGVGVGPERSYTGVPGASTDSPPFVPFDQIEAHVAGVRQFVLDHPQWFGQPSMQDYANFMLRQAEVEEGIRARKAARIAAQDISSGRKSVIEPEWRQ